LSQAIAENGEDAYHIVEEVPENVAAINAAVSALRWVVSLEVLIWWVVSIEVLIWWVVSIKVLIWWVVNIEEVLIWWVVSQTLYASRVRFVLSIFLHNARRKRT
jgi:hypothetical protein